MMRDWREQATYRPCWIVIEWVARNGELCLAEVKLAGPQMTRWGEHATRESREQWRYPSLSSLPSWLARIVAAHIPEGYRLSQVRLLDAS